MPAFQVTAPLSQAISPRKSWLRDLAAIAILSLLWFCGLLGLRPLGNPDEGRYTEIPREMAASGNYVTPQLNGVLYLEKPPLVYWLSAATFKVFGVNQFTARLWNGIFAVLGVLAVYACARHLYGRPAGLWSAGVLATSTLYFVLSQIILLDMAVAVTMSGALFAFILAVREAPGRKRRILFAAFYACIALAILAKGLIGIVLPGAVIFLWLLLLNRWKTLLPFHPFSGTLIVLLIAAPWHVLAARETADFLNFYFVHEHYLRFTTRIHERFEPWWFFIPYFLAGLFPWIFFTAAALRKSLAGGWKNRGQHAEAWFLVIWIAFIFLFFSKSQSKLIPYILPLFPPAAVLIGRFLAEFREARSIRIGIWCFAVSAVLVATAACVVPGPRDQPDMLAVLPGFRVLIAATFAAGAIAAVLAMRRGTPRTALAAIFLTGGLFLAEAAVLGGFFGKQSTKVLALELKKRLKPGDSVFTLGDYPQDLPAYLGRTVSVADYEGELAYGIRAEPALTSARFLSREEFPARWEAEGTHYAILRRKSYERWFSGMADAPERLAETPRYLLVMKRPTTR